MTRRQILAGFGASTLASVRLLKAARQTHAVTILSERHLLSADSARAFSCTFGKTPAIRRPILLLPGCKSLSIEAARYLRNRAQEGATILIESGLAFSDEPAIAEQRRVLERCFQLALGQPIAAPHSETHYVIFSRPGGAMVRSFGFTFPVSGEHGESIAHFGCVSVAVRKPIGRGQLLYLGSMLGPHLLAEDADAQHVATHLLAA